MSETRRRKQTQILDDLPGLFDWVDISRDDIAGKVINQSVAASLVDSDLLEMPEQALVPEDTLRFISFGSGSSGNCAYIGTRRYGVLIDAGVDNNFVTAELLRNGIDISSVAGIILTHDHGDHVKYAYALLRRNRHMLLYSTPKAFNGLLRRHNVSRRIKDYHKSVFKEFPFEVGDLTITPFEVSHDGTDNVGFAIEGAGVKFVVATDTGYITERADFYMQDANVLMIESNYDAEMLRNGTYPEYLKTRIASERGHLDNNDTAKYLSKIAPNGRLTHVFLCHLSHDNNYPDIALTTSRNAIEASGCVVEDVTGSGGIKLTALPRFGSSQLTVFHRR